MRLDYWNHPLIVKAIRVKYRGGRLFTFAASYLIMLLAGGVLLFRYREALGLKDWARVYFICMISLQFVLSAVMAVSATSSSMQTEVATRTLDFQRIATIRPLQILIGKAIGEPSASYLLAMSTIPIAVICCVMSNISLLAVIVLYVTLATTTFMMACLGLQHSLDPSSRGAQAGGIAGGFIFLTFMATGIPLRIGPRGGFLELLYAAVGLFTPILSIKGIAFDEAAGTGVWTAAMPLFNANIPYALVTPFAQTALAALGLLFMTRRLRQPLITPLSKLQSYAVLTLLDLAWAAIQFDALRLGEGLTAPAVRFAAGHTVLALLLAGRITPGRETFLSWAWRLRGRHNWIVDHLTGERTLNFLVLAAYCLIGVVVFTAIVAIPAVVMEPGILSNTDWPSLMSAAATSILVILAYGLFYQVATIAMGRGAGVAIFVVAVILMLGPLALGAIYGLNWLSGLSPVGIFINLQDPGAEPYSPIPFIVIHLLGSAFWCWGLHGMVRRLIRQVDRSLETMHVAPAAATT